MADGDAVSWPTTEADLLATQRRLVVAEPAPWRPPPRALAVAGCFVCNQRGRGGPGAAGEAGRIGDRG